MAGQLTLVCSEVSLPAGSMGVYAKTASPLILTGNYLCQKEVCAESRIGTIDAANDSHRE